MSNRMMMAAACMLAAACQQQGGNDSAAAGNGADADRSATAGSTGQAKQSLGDGLGASADHGRLVNALKAAGLAETLSGAQPYTIFAPTDAAFQKLDSGGADTLLAPENKAQLVDLLTGHIVPGLVTGQDLGRAIDRGKGKAQLATVNGATLTFTRSGDAIVIESPGGGRAQIGGAEALQSNGAIHSVDAVLMPK